MEIQANRIGDIVILHPSGDLVSRENIYKLFMGHFRRKVKKFIINLESVRKINSVGLNALLEIRQILEGGGGTLRLCCINDNVNKMFEITRLIELFSINQNEDSAIAGLMSAIPFMNAEMPISRYQN
ncbi:MAG: STAS domain-containing protein [bacterium]